jgi:hypothetical protein
MLYIRDECQINSKEAVRNHTACHHGDREVACTKFKGGRLFYAARNRVMVRTLGGIFDFVALRECEHKPKQRGRLMVHAPTTCRMMGGGENTG